MLSPPADGLPASCKPAVPATPTEAGAPRPADVHDEGFAAVLAVAADLFDCPYTMLWVAEAGGMRLAATRGLPSTPATAGTRLVSAVDGRTPMVVLSDASDDPRFRDDVLVAGPAGLRFFIAIALLGPGGELLGVLGAGDHQRRDGLRDIDVARIGPLTALATRVFGGGALARYRQVAEVGFSAIVVVDDQGRLNFANAAARDLLGPVAVPGQPLDALFPPLLQLEPEAVSGWLHEPSAADEGEASSSRELRIRDALGELRTLEAVRCDWHDGAARGVALVLRDITDHGVGRREPRTGRRDALTGLPNREALFATIESVRGQGGALAVALLGLDNFRIVNEALGHVVGDTVLQVVACRLMAWLPAEAHLARFGGDEFAIVFPAVGDVAELEQRLRALLREIARPCEIEHQRVHVEGCIGLALDDTGDTAAYDDGSSGLLALAALALRHAKLGGSLQLRRFSPAMREEALDRRHLDLELRRAFRDGEFELHYQPQIQLDSGLPAGAEALLRWRHPERGLLMPAAFIDALAHSAIAQSVGTWVLHQACRDAASWPAVGGRRLKVGVNLFPAQFNDDALVEKVDAALAASRLAPSQLEIELTETIALRDDGIAEKTLMQLRKRGIRVSYDDFGTGHASLSMLHRLPVDRVKIDRSFVRDMLGSRGDKAIVRSIALIANNFDMEVIAEGVESLAQAELLRDFGCHEVQGFLYSKALAPLPFQRWLAGQAAAALEAQA
jgi:diguanylate cyclase (GGDEF)-like protein/PAS domain S-box-containing protein